MEQQTARYNAEIAIENRLYVSGWGLLAALKLAVAYPALFYVDLHYVDGKPVGVVLAKYKMTERTHVNAVGIQVFVKPDFRRSGIASTLVKTAMEKVPRKTKSDFRASKGTAGSDHFWRSHGVKPWYCPRRQTPDQWEYT